MLRLPPSPTLFPYTTLFRSRPVRSNSLSTSTRPDPQMPMGATSPITLSRKPPSSSDRKSTRLNSSHVRISYAVFCLKKKKDVEALGGRPARGDEQVAAAVVD